jgi:MFS family permease
MDAGKDTRWSVVMAAVGAGIIGAAHIGKVPAALPLMRSELSLDLIAAGWVVSIYSATGMTLGMLIGVFADRIGHRALAVVGVALMGVGSALGALATDAFFLLLSRFIEGLGFVVAAVTAPSLIARAVGPAHKRFAFGLWGSFMSTGMGGMLLISPVVLAAWGWRGAWLVMAAASFAWALNMAFVLRAMPQGEAAPGRGARAWHDIAVTSASPGPWLLAICFGCYTLLWTALMVWLPTFLVEQRGAGLGGAALLTVVVVLVNLPGNIIGGWLNQKGIPRWRLIAFVGVLFSIAGPLIFLNVLPDGTRLGLALAFSFFGGFLPSSVLGAAPVFSPTPAQIGATNGLLVQGSHLGQFMGPPLVAAAVAFLGGWQAGAWIFGTCGAAVIVFSLLIGRAEARLARD